MTSIVGHTLAHQIAREHERRILAIGLMGSALAHWVFFGFAPRFTTTDVGFTTESLVAVEMPAEIEIPPPPQAIARPAAPVVSSMTIDEDITIAPTTFEANPIEALPPPPTEETPEIADAPTFTPMTVKPTLRNSEEITKLLERHYPPVLRDAGVGGTVLLWVFIDSAGQVRNALVKESSGYSAFDEAAITIAPRMEFSAAMNRDQRVPVWISLDLVFEVLRGP